MPDLFLRAPRLLQDDHGALVQRRAVRREFDAARAAAHQFGAHALLKLAQAARGGRLRHEQGARGRADAAVFGNQDKGAQLAKVHGPGL
ncbi:hypothetical protein D3C71_1680380 [compost metagenome]